MHPRYFRSRVCRPAYRAIALLAATVLPGLHLHAQSCDPAVSSSIGCFISVTPATQGQLLVYPSATHTFQLLEKTGRDRYTVGAATGTLLPTNNDFTGFVGRVVGNRRSSVDGYLSINHENDPGGVSMLSVHFDIPTGLWSVDTIRKVDYTPVVKSTRNCAGTVTPWGTIISSEESVNTGDANADGYQDVGYQTEIDPITATIIDHDGNGAPDKLWAMGRMSHENCAIRSDGVTVYQGEDGNSCALYKFVANTPRDLSSGTLYVLQRSSADSTVGTWIQVPNTTQAQRNNVFNAGKSVALGGVGGTDWSKVYGYTGSGGIEEVDIDQAGRVYFTEKGQGRIWRFVDNGATVSGIETYVGPSSRVYPITTASGIINEQWREGIDNLAFDGDGNLWGLQDGGRNHIWVIRDGHTQANPKVELFAITPVASEPTGITFSPDYRYLFISFQHPNTTNTATQTDAAGQTVTWNNVSTIVIARKENLGAAFRDSRLPVELAGFDLQAEKQSVALSWHTASEVNNAGFELERASDRDTTFRRIVSYLNDPALAGLGTSSSGKFYSYVDGAGEGLPDGTYRYRLVDVSTDGVRTTHQEKSARIEAEDEVMAAGLFTMGNVTPNPVSNHLAIPLYLAEAGTITIELYNSAGSLVATPVSGRMMNPGSQQIEIDVDGLPAGVYHLRGTTRQGIRTREFVIAR